MIEFGFTIDDNKTFGKLLQKVLQKVP